MQSDPQKNGNKFQAPHIVRNGKGKESIEGIIQDPYKSKNIVQLAKKETTEVVATPIMSVWYYVDSIPKELNKLNVTKLAYRMDDASRPSIKFVVSKEPSLKDIETFAEQSYLKAQGVQIQQTEY